MAKKGSATRRLIKLFGIFIITVFVLGLFANAMGWLERGENAKIVEAEKAEIRTITQIVSVSGKIQPETEVIIRPDVSGEVSTGISDNRYMQIQSGLDEGEEVVTGSYRILSRELADGDPVEVRNQSNLIASN